VHSNGGIKNKQKVGNLVHLKTADKQILTANLPFLMRKQTAVGISIPHLSLSKFPSMCIEYFYVFIKKVYCVIGRNKSGTSVKHSGVISPLFFLVKVDALSNNWQKQFVMRPSFPLPTHNRLTDSSKMRSDGLPFFLYPRLFSTNNGRRNQTVAGFVETSILN